MSRYEDTKRFWDRHEKEDYECPGCGTTLDDGAKFEVHHIDGHPSNGSDENLIALCRDCHWDKHGIEPGKRNGHWSEEYFNEWNSDQTPLKYL